MIRDFTSGFFKNIVDCFRGTNLIYHAVAIVSTIVLVTSGFDWFFYASTRSPIFSWAILGAGFGGFFVPIIFPLILYIIAGVRKNRSLALTAGAIAQAEAIAWLISSTYKAFTGRVQPEYYSIGTTDISHEFHFGFWQHGIFWGWPSSHAAVAFAGAIAVFYVCRNTFVRTIVIVYAIFVGTGAAIGFHWFSDVIAGILIGSMIGMTVGAHYRKAILRDTN